MKKINIINAANILGSLAINKVKKEDVKTPLLLNYIKLRKAAQSYQDEQQAIIDKFREDYKDEIEVVAPLREKGLPLDGHEAFLKAEMDLNRLLDKTVTEECKVEGLTLIPVADFAEAVADSDLSLERIALLEGVVIE